MPSVGSPLRDILPDETVQDGCTVAEITGAAGTPGGAVMATCAEGDEVQPLRLVTV